MSPSTRRREQLPAINRNAARDQSELPPAIIGIRNADCVSKLRLRHATEQALCSDEPTDFNILGLRALWARFPLSPWHTVFSPVGAPL